MSSNASAASLAVSTASATLARARANPERILGSSSTIRMRKPARSGWGVRRANPPSEFCSFMSRARFQGESDGEGCARLPCLIADVATVLADQLLAQSKPHATALAFGGKIGLEEVGPHFR